MTASVSDLKQWYDEGVRKGATHMIVALDTFDYDNFPVYAKTPEECLAKYDEYTTKSMSRVDEVYDLSIPFQSVGRVLQLPKVKP